MAEGKLILNTTVPSNFALIEREDLLQRCFPNRLVTASEAMREFAMGQAKGLLPKRNWDWLLVETLGSDQERALFRTIAQQLGEGESACLALAFYREYKLLSDDRDAREYAQRLGVPVSGTLGILLEAVHQGVLSLPEANRLLSLMIEKGYFSPVGRLDELV